jgi:hypothetical protein
MMGGRLFGQTVAGVARMRAGGRGFGMVGRKSAGAGVGAGANLFGFGGVVGMAQGGLVVSGSKNIINSILGGFS